MHRRWSLGRNVSKWVRRVKLREMALANIGRETASTQVATISEAVAKPIHSVPIIDAPTVITEEITASTDLKPAELQPASVTSPVAAALATDSKLGIALVGDSMMAVGLAPYLKRTLGKQENVHLITAFRSGTGLARPEVFDWIAEYPKLLDGQTVNLVICAMGANDAQGFVENGKVQAFDTPEWHATYRQRVLDLAKLLTRDGTKVVWMTLPVMRSDKFSAKTARINQILKEVLTDLADVQVLDANTVLADEAGHFRPFAKDAKGKLVSLRQGDGIHVTDAGAQLLADKLLPLLSNVAPIKLSTLN